MPAETLHTTRRTLTIAGADKLIEAAVAKANEIKVPMCIAIVDESGILKAFRRSSCKSAVSAHTVIIQRTRLA